MLVIYVIALLNSSLGFVVIARNPKSATNRIFFVLSLSTAAWMISSGFTDHAIANQREFWAKLAFIFPVLVTVSVTSLSFFFPRKIRIRARDVIFISIATFGLVLLSASDLIVADVKIINESSTHIVPGELYLLYVAALILLVAKAVFNIIKGTKNQNRGTLAQAKNFFLGFALSFIWVLLTNVLIPIISTINTPKYGPLGTIIFLGFTAYSIVKHRLFDIRLVVARSLGYLLSLAVLLAVYGMAGSLLSTQFSEHLDSNSGLSIALTATLVSVAALSYTPLKRQFDKLTNKLFYRDAYDPQAFLDELNQELVSNVDLESLLKQTSEIIDRNIKSSYCLFGLKETAYEPQRVIGTSSKQFSDEDVDKARSITPKIDTPLIVAENIDENSQLKTLLRKYDIAILGRLAPEAHMDTEGLGYLILGPKKSGNPYNKQDVRILAIIINELVIAIQNALRFEEIEKFNITLQERVDKATAELQRTNEKLKQMDETKDEFISMASHQLRTPLTSAKGYLSMVLEGDVGKVNKQQSKMLEQAYLSSQRMVYLIADLLNVSRLKTGKFIIDAKESDLAEVVETEVEQLIPSAKLRNLKLSYKKPKKFPIVMIDETKIRQVIMNFIDNAIYYTPSGGKINVSLKETKKAIEFRVEDNGLGVPKKEQHNLFSKFYRAGNARKARPDGTGLGLFMAKKVVVAQGGAIIFESEEGKGSTFGFSFSKAALEKLRTTG